MGLLSDWDKRTDILAQLASHGMLEQVESVFHNLRSGDLRAVRLVSSTWLGLVNQLIQHGERGSAYLNHRWKQGEPMVDRMQCTRERSVCTITSLAVDDRSIAAGMGSNGKIEVWNRRTLERDLQLPGHKEGVYSLQFGRYILVSGGEDGTVRIWSRASGTELAALEHHTYIVWCVRLNMNQLVTASYDCTVAFLTIQETETAFSSEVTQKIQGPWEWADALHVTDAGDNIVVHDEESNVLQVWDVKGLEIVSRLSGHTEEVHSVNMKGEILVSGSSDRKIIIWLWRTGECYKILEGHQGKVWSVSIHRNRLGSGGRHGEVRIWNVPGLEDVIQEGRHSSEAGEPEVIKTSRVLLYHPKSTSIAAVHIDSFCLVSGDGLATLVQSDFWCRQTTSLPCQKYTTPIPDPLLRA